MRESLKMNGEVVLEILSAFSSELIAVQWKWDFSRVALRILERHVSWPIRFAVMHDEKLKR